MKRISLSYTAILIVSAFVTILTVVAYIRLAIYIIEIYF